MKNITQPVKNLKLIQLEQLKQHEQINKEHFNKLMSEIKENRYVNPIIVDINSFVILDGHHRYNIVKEMGLDVIPVFLVDYEEDSVKVTSWRKNIEVTKKEVIQRGMTGKLYPVKTSRHMVNGIQKIDVSLEELK